MEKKASEAEALISTSATKKEALQHAITAIESYIAASKQAATEDERARLKAKSRELLGFAEKIKKTEIWAPKPSTSTANRTQTLKTPVCSRTLTTKEEVLLLESSRLHGFKFPPWKAEPPQGFFQGAGELFEDTADLSLSETQNEEFDGWRRPHEALAGRDADGPKAPITPLMNIAAEDIDLVQDVTTDCSVVASLCAATARMKQGHGTLLSSLFYPYDDVTGCPALSQNGRYIFKFHFNGCYRLVSIDDRLPTSRSSRTLHVVDRRNPGLLWPALLEKAYLKVRGGYNFPGSNSGTDLWVLTGWVPEQIFLRSDDVRSEQLWHRIFKAYGYGDVMITMGTGRLTSSEERSFGLVGEHDYAVLDLKEQDGLRLVLVKNPWCEGNLFSQKDLSSQSSKASFWTSNLREALPDIPQTQPGTFWMSFDTIIQHFESLYLNWNPGLFKYRQNHHFSWAIPKISSPGSFVQNPQYAVRSVKDNTVWVLLSRHFKTEELGILNKAAHTLADAASSLGFISLYAFDNDGNKVYLSDSALLRGPFVDSPQTLLRFELPAGKAYTIVVVQESLPLEKYAFTLSLFSQHHLTVAEPVDPYRHYTQISGNWNENTAGGNANSPDYSINPQFRIDIPQPTPLHILLEASPPELAVHVEFVWSDGKRIPAITTKDILAASGDYRRGCAVARLSSIPAGSYTIVVSTFEPGQLGSFILRVGAMAPCTLRALPSEDAGRLRTPLMPAQFTPGIDRLLAPVHVSRLTRFMVVARHATVPATATAAAKSQLRLSLERGQGPNKIIVASSGSGEFQGLPTGVRCPDVDIGPDTTRSAGGLWLVLERLPGSSSGAELVGVEVLSEGLIEVGVWGIGDG